MFKTVGNQTLGISLVFFGGPNPFFTIPPSDAVWARGGPEAPQDFFGEFLRLHLGTSGGLSWDLFPLLQIALRTCHFELCIRPSTPLPPASTRPFASQSLARRNARSDEIKIVTLIIITTIRRPHRGTTAVARLCFATSPPYRYLSSLSFLTSRDPESLAVKFLSSYLLSFLGSKYLGT